MKFLWKKLYDRLEKSRSTRSWREIAREGGFSPSLFTRLSQGKAISVVNLLKVMQSGGFMPRDIQLFVKSNKP